MRKAISCDEARLLRAEPMKVKFLTRRESTELARHRHQQHDGADCPKEDTTMLPMNDDTPIALNQTHAWYKEDPDEVTPCLVCGEPKPNSEPCLNGDCSMFGGARRFVTITFMVEAANDDEMANADSIREWIEQALREEGMFDWPDVSEVTGMPDGMWLAQSSLEPGFDGEGHE